ncbi:hypothetical protein [Sphaerisporangium fuscum]|uniref:hypothetical protein n=1 Tax=Sphaerisporangium fuscum TaxID=2835868 RepID=UPI001BDC352E|nr:hypothetical protein [Sphaerisporangium fuscum]
MESAPIGESLPQPDGTPRPFAPLRILAAPPGLPLLGATAADALLLLYDASAPGGYFNVFLLTFFGTPAIIAIWILRLAIAVARRDGRRGLQRHWARWAALPIAGALAIGAVHLDIPLRTR